jgi:hypothetical protein
MGSDEQQQSPLWKDAERERRQQALAALARQAQAATNAAPVDSTMPATARPISLAPRRTRPARRGLLVALLAAVVFAGSGIAFWRTHQPQAAAPRPIPTTLTIHLRLKGLYCPSGVTWSLDGLTLAVFALRTDCRTAGTYYSVLALFDARTGALQRTLDPYTALNRLGVQNTFVQSVLWSQDGKSLIFFVSYNPSLVNAVPASGLLYYPLDGGSPRYVSGPAAFFTSAVIWDLRTQRPVATVDSVLPAASSYAWTADGHIIPSDSPSATSQGFSLWQDGVLQPIQPVIHDAPAFEQPPVTLLYSSYPTEVSPDGRYAVGGLPLGAQVPMAAGAVVPKLDAKTCGFFKYQHLCDSASLPYPDKAFTAVAALTAAGVTISPEGSTYTYTQWNQAQLACRPDGKVLAAILPNGVPQNDPSEERVTFFDAASGAQLGIVTATVVSDVSLGTPGVPFLAWSPSGKQLAFFDYGASTVTLWGGAALPA